MTDTHDPRNQNGPPPLPATAGEPPPLPGGTLQFDKAEFAQAASIGCGGCQQPITTEYYELNGTTLCGTCRGSAAGEKGTPFTRILRAAFAGAGAAFAGGLLYFLVAYLFHAEIGLISIAVGFAVGVAVKWGSYGRGGAPYQAMAVGLTYFAIVASLMAVGLIQLVNSGEETASSTASTTGSPAGDAADGASSIRSEAAGVNAGGENTAEQAGTLVSLVMLAGVMLALPFLGGFENIIGIAIIAFGLWEAWKINKRPAITGPHAVARSNAQALS